MQAASRCTRWPGRRNCTSARSASTRSITSASGAVCRGRRRTRDRGTIRRRGCMRGIKPSPPTLLPQGEGRKIKSMSINTANVIWVTASELMEEARRHILPMRSVLDVGAGIRPQTYFTPEVHVCIEPNPAYYQYLMEHFREPRYVIFKTCWDKVLPVMAHRSVDSVMALDFIEHLDMDKDDGRWFIEEAQRIARRQVVIFTPLGFLPQDYPEGSLDGNGLSAGPWQTHRSGWRPEDFGADWELVGCQDWRRTDGNDRPLAEPSG